MEHVHKVVYINLAKRQDRKAEIEVELAKAAITAERFEAIERRPGIVGCGLSHLAVLKQARDQNAPNVLIFEDDFQFVVEPEVFHDTLQQFFNTIAEWDVLMFSYALEKSEPYKTHTVFGKVVAATTASAYLVHQRFYDTLIQTLETALPLLESTGQHWYYANDQCWKALQPKAQWFYTLTRIGIQRGSYSDNSYEYMDRGV
jgi:glycosyl transferase, family 25